MSSFKSNENIHKKEDGPYYVVSANKAKLRRGINYYFFLPQKRIDNYENSIVYVCILGDHFLL